jgi:hypothetical protein
MRSGQPAAFSTPETSPSKEAELTRLYIAAGLRSAEEEG